MMRKMVPLKTKRTDPNQGGEVHARKGVQDGSTRLASERRVGVGNDVGMVMDG